MDTKLYGAIEMNIEGAVYETALALEGIERQKFLDKVFRDDPEGRARMERMLQRSGESNALFLELHEHGGLLASEILEGSMSDELPVAAVENGPEEPGMQIGPYRLISRIGEGGCGVVYEAEQLEPVRRRVALKVIRLGMDTENVIARFEAERQALALMDHPNIAHVFDAGATSTGRPYFVMERVTGERITTWCDREKLDIPARIHLFIGVCQAIQHAHQKGVIHRDIKPSNILVTSKDGVPMPKVIDFGIAKAANPSGGLMQNGWTMRDQFIGTPPYMSPEQVDLSGVDVDTRSDVYSLGALLHELLCGRAPFDEAQLSKLGISEMRRTILEVDPPLMSRRLATMPRKELEEIATARREEPGRLISRLRGDLESIVATAIAKNRNDRYQTVNALAADLRRFLANEPVLAHRPGRLYLLRKFIRRNRVVCLSALAVVGSLVAGLGASTWLYFRERKALAARELLRREAESARARETWLREQAQARANVSQVAVLLSEGKIEEADALLRKSPLESIEPSREAAGVFRALGNWNAVYGRWKQAVQCYVLLDQANRLDDPVKTLEEFDLLAIAPALLAHEDQEAYERFRREILDLYLPVQNSLQAEHLLKATLLTPANPEMLERLRGTADICAQGIPTESGVERFAEWEALSMALYSYRMGDMNRALEWATESFKYPITTGSRYATLYSITAMAQFRLGNPRQAVRDIREARRLIKAGEELPLTDRGYWFSWMIARILLDEAERTIRQGN